MLEVAELGFRATLGKGVDAAQAASRHRLRAMLKSEHHHGFLRKFQLAALAAAKSLPIAPSSSPVVSGCLPSVYRPARGSSLGR